MEFSEYLRHLRDPATHLSVAGLRHLHDLTSERAEALRSAWPEMDAERRQQVVCQLTELAEDNVELNFDAVFFTALDDPEADVRAAAVRGLWEYEDAHGNTHSLDDLHDRLTLGGNILTEERVATEMVRDGALTDSLPDDMSLAKLKKQGYQRFTGLGLSVLDLNQASDIKPDETFAHSTWNTQKKMPYPTLTRRAQFYIDHPWFLEAGEGFHSQREPEDGR